jgi:hypothetical protein
MKFRTQNLFIATATAGLMLAGGAHARYYSQPLTGAGSTVQPSQQWQQRQRQAQQPQVNRPDPLTMARINAIEQNPKTAVGIQAGLALNNVRGAIINGAATIVGGATIVFQPEIAPMAYTPTAIAAAKTAYNAYSACNNAQWAYYAYQVHSQRACLPNYPGR